MVPGTVVESLRRMIEADHCGIEEALAGHRYEKEVMDRSGNEVVVDLGTVEGHSGIADGKTGVQEDGTEVAAQRVED